MSYDISLTDPITKETLELGEAHHMRGGTYCVGGELGARLNVTYNYSGHLGRVLKGAGWTDPYDGERDEAGLRSIYGMTGAESIPALESAISQLGDDVDSDYWKATEGNVKRALAQLLALAKMRPDGVWMGD